MYQSLIFLIAFLLNFFNRLRQQYILRANQCSVQSNNQQVNDCNDFQYSITISAGIGFIFLGNIYDNVERPRQVTVVLLVILAVISMIEAIFSSKLTSNATSQTTDVSLTLYQMSSVFEAGVSLASIVIMHNWFKEEILGTMTSIWFAAIYLQLVCQDLIYQTDPSSVDAKDLIAQQLQLQSIVLCVFYTLMSVICWFFFYHHPQHIGINISKSKGNVVNFGFNVDNTQSIFASKPLTSSPDVNQRFGISTEGIDSNNAIEGQSTEKVSTKLDVTLIDAFRIKELNLLILSYIFRETHDAFIKQSNELAMPDSYENARIQQLNYSIGAAVGIVTAGIVGDLFLHNLHFLQILLANILLLGLDIFLFCQDIDKLMADNTNTIQWLYIMIGFVLASNDLVYLILLPMLIAKKHSEKMAQNSRFQRICFAGTIAGVVLALCTVGKYLFSENLASFLTFMCNLGNSTATWPQDIVAIGLLLIANLIIGSQIIKEFRQTSVYKYCCGPRRFSVDRNESENQSSNKDLQQSRQLSGQLLMG